MATFTQTMSGDSRYSITLTVTETSYSIANNTSDVHYKLTATKSSGGGYYTYNQNNPVKVIINGSTKVNVNISYDFSTSTPCTLTLAEGDVTGIAHNSDGTKTIAVSGSFTDNDNSLGSATASGNLTLTTIPRQTTITSFTVSKRNETSLTFNWGTADTIDYVWYSTNNGSSWTGYNVTDGTSGSFNVTGLSPNTTYTCKLRVRRKDSQMTTDSSSVSQTTYKVPTQSLNTKTEVSIKMNWSIDTTADYIWYSTNNGSSWTAVGSVNATSGNYTISGLSASTTYNIKTRVRRSATQTTYDTTALAVTTASYPAFTTQPTYNARTETTLDVTYKPNMTVALAQYRIKTSGGSYGSWVNINSNNIISGSATSTAGCTFRISSLTANTNYVVQVRLKSTLTEHYTNSSEVSTNMYTYAYPYCTASPNFTISNSGVTLTFYNPLSRTIDINIIGNGTQLAYTWSTSGTSKVVFDGATTQGQLYATIPNQTSATYQVKVTYNGNVSTRSNNNTYTINVNDCKPTFSNFAYSTNYSSLTGNNATIINGKTTTTFTISTSNKATGKNSATITKYRLECGTQTKDVTYSSSASVSDTIANCANQIIKVSAIDSRGLETTVSKTVTNFVNYSKPSFRDITTNRDDGVETTTKLNFRVNYWDGSFGSLSNTITSVQYRSKLTTASSYGSYTTIPVSSLTLSNGIARLEDYLIHANGSSGGFEVGKSYNVEVKVVDGNGSTTLETITTTSNVTDGNVAFSTYQDSNGKYHIGFNGMPNQNARLAVDGEPLYGDIVISSTEPTTSEKVWLQKGKNLFNPKIHNFEFGTLSSSDGSDYSDDGKIRLTQFLEVQPNTRYKFSNAENIGCNRIVEYDENGVFIRYISGVSTLTTQSTTRKIRWVYSTTTTPTYIQVEAKASGNATAYEAYIDKKIYTKNADGVYEEFYNENKKEVVINSTAPANKEEKVWLQNPKNKLEGFKLGDISSTTGVETSSTSTVISTNYIPIDLNTTYYFSVNGALASSSLNIRVYNKRYEYIGHSSLSKNGGKLGAITKTTSVVDDTPVYIRLRTTLTNIGAINNPVMFSTNGDLTYQPYDSQKIYIKNESDVYEKFYVDIETKAKILYSDATGTDGDISLNSDINDYKYIEIRYVHGTGAYLNNQIIKVPTDVVHFNIHSIFSGSYATYIRNNVYTISSYKIAFDLTQGFQITNSSGTLSTSTSYLIKVLEVVGYK